MPRRKANTGNITGTEESKTAKSIRVFRINVLKVHKKKSRKAYLIIISTETEALILV